jgi:hypothetical protein
MNAGSENINIRIARNTKEILEYSNSDASAAVLLEVLDT